MFKFLNKINNKKGFTLIELIIVIAILGIILAIAVPRFGAIQENAKKDADKATGGMIAKAAELYSVLNNNTTTVTMGALTTNDSYLNSNTKFQYYKNDSNLADAEITLSNGKATVKAKEPNGETYTVTLYPAP